MEEIFDNNQLLKLESIIEKCRSYIDSSPEKCNKSINELISYSKNVLNDCKVNDQIKRNLCFLVANMYIMLAQIAFEYLNDKVAGKSAILHASYFGDKVETYWCEQELSQRDSK